MMTENANEPAAGAATDKPHEKDELGAVAVASEEGAGQNGAAPAPEAATGTEPAKSAAAAELPSAPGTGEPTAAAPATAESAPTQDFGALLDNYEKESAASIQEGEVVRGMVVDISDQNVLVDIGYKSEGVVPREEITDSQGNVTVKRGDEIDVLIKSLENQDGYAVLSRADAV